MRLRYTVSMPIGARLLLLSPLLTGCIETGVQLRVFRDAWTQNERDGGVDILWVVDDSASMYEEQDQLEAHADSFISYLSQVPVDFHLAVTSTDMEVDIPGALVGEVMSEDLSLIHI